MKIGNKVVFFKVKDEDIEEFLFLMIKGMDGNITLNQLQDVAEGWASNDDVTKASWKWLQHRKQE